MLSVFDCPFVKLLAKDDISSVEVSMIPDATETIGQTCPNISSRDAHRPALYAVSNSQDAGGITLARG